MAETQPRDTFQLITSGVATVGRLPPRPGSILALKKYMFSYVASNVKRSFWKEIFRL